MIAFELSNQERTLCTAGIPDARRHPLSVTVTNVWSRGDDGELEGFTAVVHGMRPGEGRGEQMTWRTGHRMDVGDELRIRLVEVAEVDEPTEVKPSRRASEVHPHCAFCGATAEEAGGMTYGREAAICKQCVQRFADIQPRRQR